MSSAPADEQAARQSCGGGLSPSHFGTTSRQGLIFGFGGTTVAEIPHAVRQLRAVLGSERAR